MDQIIVTKPDGSTYPLASKRTATQIKSAKQTMELLGNDTVSINVVSPFPQTYGIGDRISVFGRVYKINQLPKVSKTGTHEFTYDIEFEGVQYDLLCATYDLTIDTTSNSLQDVQAESLTGDLERFATVLISNANRVFPNTWVLGTCPESETKTLTFSEDDNCLSVLQTLCSEDNFNIEFEIVQNNGVNTINFKTVGQIFPYTFQFGRGKGLYALTRQNVSSSSIVTRLKVYGSSSNITSKYRAARLCLPSCGKAQSYIQKASAVNLYGIIEGKKYFDDIMPTFTGAVTSVVASDVTKFADTSMFDLNEKEEDGITTKYLIDGVSAKIHFNTGNLAGYEFEVHAYNHATHTFTLCKQKDDRGDEFPSATSSAFQFAVGDEYKILDVALPDRYVMDAEDELFAQANTYYDQNCQPQVQYGLSVTEEFLKTMVGNGSTVNIFQPGDYIPINDSHIDVDKSVRVQSFTRSLLNEYEYDLAISDTVSSNITNRVISELINIDNIIQMNNLGNPARARANWRTSQELLGMVFDPDGDYYSEKIKPLSIETTMLSVAAKSQQFTLQDTRFEPNYEGNSNVVRVYGGSLVHYAIADTIKTWTLTDNTTTLNSNDAYYIYAKCVRSGSSGTILFDTTQRVVDSEALYYYFLIGTISSVISDEGGENSARIVSLTYGSSTINGRFIRTGVISSNTGNLTIDLDNATITAINGATIQGALKFTNGDDVATVIETAQSDAESHADTAAANAQSAAESYAATLGEGLQSQIDGVIDSYFYDYVPTLSNYPASDWTTNTLKDRHIGDTFTNTAQYSEDPDNAGKSWRFVKNNSVYSWTPIADSDAVLALQQAAAAQDTADGKRRVFVTTPTPPYDIGDLWAGGSSGDLKKCKTAKTNVQSYAAADWELATKYTDDTAADAAQAAAEEAAEAAETANAAIESINSDSIFDESEKKVVRREWYAISGNNDTTSSMSSGGSYYKAYYGITDVTTAITTLRSNLASAVAALKSYLNSVQLYTTGNFTFTTTYTRAMLSTKFTAYYNAETALLNGIATYYSDLAESTAIAHADAIAVGTRNLWANKYMVAWNDSIADTTLTGSDSDGSYYSIYNSSLYAICRVDGVAYAGNLLPQITFKENTRYCFKVRWKLAAEQTGRGIYFGVAYTDGTREWLSIIAATQTTIIEQTGISAANKTIDRVIGTHNSTGRTYIYNIQLTEGTKQTPDWLIAPEDQATISELETAQLAADNAAAAAAAANAAISNINSDGVFDETEKKVVRREWYAISGNNDTTSNMSSGGSYYKAYYGITDVTTAITTLRSNLASAVTALKSYLNSVQLYTTGNFTFTTTYTRAMLSTKFTDYYNAETALLNGIAKYQSDVAATAAANAAQEAAEATAVTEGFTTIDGGLITANHLKLGDSDGNEKAGISGMQNSSGASPAVWAGGTYAEAVAMLAQIVIQHTGEAKLGIFQVQSGGLVVIYDTGGTPRLTLKNSSVTNITNLIAATTYNADLEGLTVSTITRSTVGTTSSTVDLITSFEVPASRAGTKMVITAGSITAAMSNTLVQGEAVNGTVSCSVHIYKGETAIGTIAELYYSDMQSPNGGTFTVNIRTTQTLDTGTYYIKAVYSILTTDAATTASLSFVNIVGTLSFEATAERSEFGSNGISFFRDSGNYLYSAFERNEMVLKARGKVDITGANVLIGAKVTANGLFVKYCGRYDLSAITHTSTGVYYIPHNIGHANFVATANAYYASGSLICMVDVNSSQIVVNIVNRSGTYVNANFNLIVVGAFE